MKNLKPVNHYITKLNNGMSLVEGKKFIDDGIYLTLGEQQTLAGLTYSGLAGHLPFMIDGSVKRVKVHPFIEAIGETIVGCMNLVEMNNIMDIHRIPGANQSFEIEKYKCIFSKLGANPESFIEAVKKNKTEKGFWG